jgi:predicted tellurium resistance membrane protein TerC
MDLLTDPQTWASFLTLSALEIVLGVDNVLFLAIVTAKLPPDQRQKARLIGLSLALFMRVGFLLSLTWIMGLRQPIFTAFDFAFSWRDLILLLGGLFLLYKATTEMHDTVQGSAHDAAGGPSHGQPPARFSSVIVQIVILDLVFSLDSILTAIGMAPHVEVMIAAVVVAIIVMLVAAGPLGEFVNDNPTVKVLALAFLLLVGVALVADAMHFHIPRGYLYFAIAFSAGVEALNLLMRRRMDKRANGGITPP